MRFLISKFFLISILVIFFVFAYQFYNISKSYKVDRNSYVTLVKGTGLLATSGKNKVLAVDKKELLSVGDVVSIVGTESLGIIEWGDKSITRLSGNSKIVIKENLVSDRLDSINISFELLKGKTWSNVVTIIGDNSYFKQTIKGVTASVRGTVFETNYDSDYLYVQNHEVTVTNESGETKKVGAGEGILFSTFTLTDLLKIKDKLWEKVNNEMDSEYYKELRQEFLDTLNNHNFFRMIYNFFKGMYSGDQKLLNFMSTGDYVGLNDYIASLTGSERTGIVDDLKTLLQQVNFENGQDPALYDVKVNVKDTLIENSNDKSYNETLLKYSVYDLSNMLDYEKISSGAINQTMELLNKNKDLINLNSPSFDFAKGQINSLKDFLINGNSNEIINQVKDKIIETGKEKVTQGLNSLFNIFNNN